MRQMVIMVDDRLANAMKKTAIEEGVTVSGLARRVWREYLGLNSIDSVRPPGRPVDPGVRLTPEKVQEYLKDVEKERPRTAIDDELEQWAKGGRQE
jgi:hypothetical protein